MGKRVLGFGTRYCWLEQRERVTLEWAQRAPKGERAKLTSLVPRISSSGSRALARLQGGHLCSARDPIVLELSQSMVPYPKARQPQSLELWSKGYRECIYHDGYRPICRQHRPGSSRSQSDEDRVITSRPFDFGKQRRTSFRVSLEYQNNRILHI